MISMPLTEARDRLSELLDEVERTHARIAITRHGTEAAVLISRDDLKALEETLDVLASPEGMRQLAESHKDLETGNVLDPDEVAALARRRDEDESRRLVDERRDSPTVVMDQVVAETLDPDD